MRIKSIIIWLLLLLFPSLIYPTIPDLKVNDVHNKVNEFLYNHISQKKLSTELMKRALHNFIEQLDPIKGYFTEEDIKPWLEPSDEFLQQTLTAFYKSDFSTFEEIYKKMLSCIERRNRLEQEIEQMSLDQNITSKELSEQKWALNSNELKEKLFKIKSLQAKYAKKLDKDYQEKFFILLSKRRKWREQEISGTQSDHQKPLLYCYILKSIASALDSHTDYYPPDEAKQIMMQVQQRMLGIGVRLIDDLTGLKIVDLVDGGPAKKQGGLFVNDKIIAVNGELIAGMDIQQAVQLIQGQENTPVTLTILREGETGEKNPETLSVTIIRGDIVLEETRLQSYLEPFGDGVIAHIVLHSFYQDPNSSSAEDVYNTIADIKSKNNLKGVILDLRNNGGGLLIQGVSISSFFIGKGIVASTKQYDGTLIHFRNEQSNIVWDGPLIVLINKASASSAEIVAQCLQDYGRALIVGDAQSYGKGTYQLTSILPNRSTVDPKGEYKITQGMYYTVSGRTPQLVGVQSDIVIPGYLSEAKYGEQYLKYPVANNSIEANYEDKLKDVLPWNRSHYKKNYLNNLQTKIDTFSKHLPVLKENSSKRLNVNTDYQAFIKTLKEEHQEAEETFHAQNDLQLYEAFNIMKDLIYLHEKAAPEKEGSVH